MERQSKWVECGIVDESLGGGGVEGDGDHSVVDVGQKAEEDRNNLWDLFVDYNDAFDRMMGGT